MNFKICMMVFVAAFVFGYGEPKPVALQYLPPRPGYVPVYIRFGDTPLYEINAELAEAFREQRGVRPEDADLTIPSVDEKRESHQSEQMKEDKSEEKGIDKFELDLELPKGEKEERVSQTESKDEYKPSYKIEINTKQ